MTIWERVRFWRRKTDQAPRNRSEDVAAKKDGKGSVKLLPVIVTGRDTRVRSWVGRFIETLSAVGIYAVIGIAVGLIILARRHIPILQGIDGAFPDQKTAAELLNHIGSAFIVSAVVVVMYEWGSATKHSLDLAGALTYTLQNHIDTILNRSAHEQIANSMRQIAGWESEPFARQLTKFAKAIQTLSEKERDWAAPAYRDFIEWYHEQLTRYTHELAELSTNLREDPNSRTEFRFVLPAATDVADVMLEKVTKEMGAKGTYYAVSNAFTWTKLTRFRAAQQEAIKNGLEVQRIFIIGTDPDRHVDLSVAMKVLLGHHDDAEKSNGKYKIKLIDWPQFEDFVKRTPEMPKHFGIFQPQDKTKQTPEVKHTTEAKHTPVIFQVQNDELTKFVMTGAAETSPILIAFEQLWRDLPIELPSKNDPEVIWDHLLAWRTRRLAKGDTVRAALPIRMSLGTDQTQNRPAGGEEKPQPSASTPSGSAQPALRWCPREFDKATAEATADSKRPAEVTIKRLFVVESAEELKDKEVDRLLRRHESMRHKDRYEWRSILRKDLPESIRDEVPFVLIGEHPPDHNDKKVIEVVQQNAQNAFDQQSEKVDLLTTGFDEAWGKAKPPDSNSGTKPQ